LDLNKFEAAATESHLVERALDLLAEERFWAGVVFQNIPADAARPPAHVRYKIRMDIDEVERTNHIKKR